MKLIRKVGISLSVTILGVFIVAFALFKIPSTGWKALIVPTSSMKPTIPPGSLILVHSVPTSSLRNGDVITYTNPKKLQTTITHRIVRQFLIGGKVQGYITKGDANQTVDNPIVAGSIQGKAIWHIPKLGYFFIWMKKPIGLVLLIYIPALLLMIEEVRRLSEYFRLSQPYRLRRFVKIKNSRHTIRKLSVSTFISILFITSIGLFSWHVQALLKSNIVSLTQNKIGVAVGNNCSNNSNTNIHINNTSTQSISSGNVNSSNNTNNGSVTSGNASASNSTTITVNINNCH